MDLTVPTFVDPPVGSRVTQVARPLDQRVVRFDHLERVCAVVGDGHVLGRRLRVPNLVKEKEGAGWKRFRAEKVMLGAKNNGILAFVFLFLFFQAQSLSCKRRAAAVLVRKRKKKRRHRQPLASTTGYPAEQ